VGVEHQLAAVVGYVCIFDRTQYYVVGKGIYSFFFSCPVVIVVVVIIIIAIHRHPFPLLGLQSLVELA